MPYKTDDYDAVIQSNLTYTQALKLMERPIDNVIKPDTKVTHMYRVYRPSEVLGYIILEGVGDNTDNADSVIVAFEIGSGGVTVQLFDEEDVDRSLTDWMVVYAKPFLKQVSQEYRP